MPTQLAREQIASMRGKARASLLLAVDDIRRRVNANHFSGVFSYAGMPWDEAERNVGLFAKEVMPELKKLNGIKAEAA